MVELTNAKSRDHRNEVIEKFNSGASLVDVAKRVAKYVVYEPPTEELIAPNGLTEKAQRAINICNELYQRCLPVVDILRSLGASPISGWRAAETEDLVIAVGPQAEGVWAVRLDPIRQIDGSYHVLTDRIIVTNHISSNPTAEELSSLEIALKSIKVKSFFGPGCLYMLDYDQAADYRYNSRCKTSG